MNTQHPRKLPNWQAFSVLITTSVLPLHSAIAESDNTFQFDTQFQQGWQYDSSLAVEELDERVDATDSVWLSQAKLNAHWNPTNSLKLKGGYHYSNRNYQEYTQFDTTIQQLFVDASNDFGFATAGVSHHHADAQLDGQDLLTLKQNSAYLSKLIHRQVFVRVAADHKDKTFDHRPERNAIGKAVSSDVYWFFNSAKTFVSAGLSVENEDATSDPLDYRGLGFKAGLSHKFLLAQQDNKLTLNYRHQYKDYRHINPDLAEPRNDQRQLLALDWQWWFNDHIALINSVSYGDYASNLDSADYSETLASIAVRVEL